MKSLDTIRRRIIRQIDCINKEIEQHRYYESTLPQAYIYNTIDTTDIFYPIIIDDKN